MSRPAFIDPNTEWVECWVCGAMVDPEVAGGIDLSTEDEYYPKMKPVCPKHARTADNTEESDQ